MLQHASSLRLPIVLCEHFSWVCTQVRLRDQTKRPNDFLLHGAVLCIAGCLVASVYPLDISSITPAPDETIKYISKHHQMAPVGQNSSQLRTTKIGRQIISFSAIIDHHKTTSPETPTSSARDFIHLCQLSPS